MACYVLTKNNCGKVLEGSNKGIDWILPEFYKMKEMSVSFTINTMLQGCAGNVDGFKISDNVGTAIWSGSETHMVPNTTLDFFSNHS